ncbi:hypothetical protein EMEDMD4_50067 [Sinorhizobium medicae]|uniref:Uncharacterized protein n=1 Tax=Sinorhizobium medicae TaxID=110321 RepID=A0A508X5J4_9HYPH|nr:hypothetical protein EMEDMD4_50067 [Sinorhizobium medicae]
MAVGHQGRCRVLDPDDAVTRAKLSSSTGASFAGPFFVARGPAAKLSLVALARVGDSRGYGWSLGMAADH